MDFTAALYEQILETLRSDSDRREQRAAPRVGLRARVTVYPAPTGGIVPEPLQAWIKDLSIGGIGLVMSVPLEPGSTFELRLASKGNGLLRLTYVAVRSKSLGTVYSIGGALATVDGPKGLALFAPKVKTVRVRQEVVRIVR